MCTTRPRTARVQQVDAPRIVSGTRAPLGNEKCLILPSCVHQPTVLFPWLLGNLLGDVYHPEMDPPPLSPGQRHGQQRVSGTADPGVVKQDKSSGGSIGTTKTRSDPQRVRMSSGDRPIGPAKGKQPNTEALCQPPPPPLPLLNGLSFIRTRQPVRCRPLEQHLLLHRPSGGKGEHHHLPQKSTPPKARQKKSPPVTMSLSWNGRILVLAHSPPPGGRGHRHMVTVPPGSGDHRRTFWVDC